MTTETVTLTSVCGGSNHLTFTLSGAASATVHMVLSDLSDPLSAEDAECFCRIIAKMAKAGRTVAQARTLLQAGVTVTV